MERVILGKKDILIYRKKSFLLFLEIDKIHPDVFSSIYAVFFFSLLLRKLQRARQIQVVPQPCSSPHTPMVFFVLEIVLNGKISDSSFLIAVNG